MITGLSLSFPSSVQRVIDITTGPKINVERWQFIVICFHSVSGIPKKYTETESRRDLYSEPCQDREVFNANSNDQEY